ncbi:50S ribosomal protein L30, partial [Gemmatimonadota bacterium]
AAAPKAPEVEVVAVEAPPEPVVEKKVKAPEAAPKKEAPKPAPKQKKKPKAAAPAAKKAVKEQPKLTGTLRITQTRSPIGRPANQKATLEALGLRRIRHTVEHRNIPSIRGMVRTVIHLVDVVEIPDK